MAWVYKQTRDDGHYYIGVCKDDSKIKSYQGSGKRFIKAYQKAPERWSKETIEQGISYEEALSLEAELVSKETLEDPLCMNLVEGGKASPMLNPKVSAKFRGDKNPMRNPEIAKKLKGEGNGMFGYEGYKERFKGSGNHFAKKATFVMNDGLVLYDVCVSVYCRENGLPKSSLFKACVKETSFPKGNIALCFYQ